MNSAVIFALLSVGTILVLTVAACAWYGRNSFDNKVEALRLSAHAIREVIRLTDGPHDEQVAAHLWVARLFISEAVTLHSTGSKDAAFLLLDDAAESLRLARQLIDPDRVEED